MNTFPLSIGTPDGLLFSGEVERVVCRSITGDLAILAGHINFCTALGMGEGHIVLPDGTTRRAACIGGMLTMMNGSCSLLATTWEWEEDIDKELEQLASAYNMEKDKILQTMGEGYKKLLAQDIKNGKALDFVYANAKLSEPKKTVKKAEKAEGETKPAAKKTTKKAADAEEKPAAKKTTKKTTKKAEAEKPETSENTEA